MADWLMSLIRAARAHEEGRDSNPDTTAANLKALTEGGLIFTGHRIDRLGVIFIATTPNRSRTVIFTPSEPARTRHPLMP